MALFADYVMSDRKPNLIINQVNPPDNFNTRSTSLWNIITPKLKLCGELIMSISCLRKKLKDALLENQHRHTQIDWVQNDFSCSELSFREQQLKSLFFVELGISCQLAIGSCTSWLYFTASHVLAAMWNVCVRSVVGIYMILIY